MFYNNCEAQLFDIRHGTDTAGKIDINELVASPESTLHNRGYQAVNELHFNKAIRSLNLSERSGFLDLGCGKGKALLLAANDRLFAFVQGVELSPALCRIAKTNVTRNLGPCHRAKVNIVEGDASTMPVSPLINVVFLFHSFDEMVLGAALSNLKKSLAARPRPLLFLYYNFHYLDLFHTNGFREVSRFNFFGPGRNLRVLASGADEGRA